jgi:hypothetical protein
MTEKYCTQKYYTEKYYTQNGIEIRNPVAYAKGGSPMFESDSIYDTKDINQNTYIYKINLEDGKKYIGKTVNIQRRMRQHFTGNGSKVTKKFKPVKYKILDNCPGFLADEIEQIYTNSYIVKYGYNNVRGGTYTNSISLHRTPEKDADQGILLNDGDDAYEPDVDCCTDDEKGDSNTLPRSLCLLTDTK